MRAPSVVVPSTRTPSFQRAQGRTGPPSQKWNVRAEDGLASRVVRNDRPVPVAETPAAERVARETQREGVAQGRGRAERTVRGVPEVPLEAHVPQERLGRIHPRRAPADPEQVAQVGDGTGRGVRRPVRGAERARFERPDERLGRAFRRGGRVLGERLRIEERPQGDDGEPEVVRTSFRPPEAGRALEVKQAALGSDERREPPLVPRADVPLQREESDGNRPAARVARAEGSGLVHVGREEADALFPGLLAFEVREAVVQGTVVGEQRQRRRRRGGSRPRTVLELNRLKPAFRAQLGLGRRLLGHAVFPKSLAALAGRAARHDAPHHDRGLHGGGAVRRVRGRRRVRGGVIGPRRGGGEGEEGDEKGEAFHEKSFSAGTTKSKNRSASTPGERRPS